MHSTRSVVRGYRTVHNTTATIKTNSQYMLMSLYLIFKKNTI